MASKQKVPIWTWRHAIAESDIPAVSKSIAWAISLHLNEMGRYSQQPFKELMRLSGVKSNKTFAVHIAGLCKYGLLSVEERRAPDGTFIERRYRPRFPDHFELSRSPAEAIEEPDDPHVENTSGRGNGAYPHVAFTDPHVENTSAYKDTSLKVDSSKKDSESTDSDPMRSGQNGFALEGGDDPKAALPARKGAKRYTADFMAFWQGYPNKSGKLEASQYWGSSKMSAEDRAAALADVPAYKASLVRPKPESPTLPLKAVNYLAKQIWLDREGEAAPADGREQQWIIALQHWERSGRKDWLLDVPKPGQTGCPISDEIIKKSGIALPAESL